MEAPSILILEKIRKLAKAAKTRERMIKIHVLPERVKRDEIELRSIKSIGNRTTAVIMESMKSSVNGEATLKIR